MWDRKGGLCGVEGGDWREGEQDRAGANEESWQVNGAERNEGTFDISQRKPLFIVSLKNKAAKLG